MSKQQARVALQCEYLGVAMAAVEFMETPIDSAIPQLFEINLRLILRLILKKKVNLSARRMRKWADPKADP